MLKNLYINIFLASVGNEFKIHFYDTSEFPKFNWQFKRCIFCQENFKKVTQELIYVASELTNLVINLLHTISVSSATDTSRMQENWGQQAEGGVKSCRSPRITRSNLVLQWSIKAEFTIAFVTEIFMIKSRSESKPIF